MDAFQIIVTTTAVIIVLLLMVYFACQLGPRANAWLRSTREEKIGLSHKKLYNANGYLVSILYQILHASIQSILSLQLSRCLPSAQLVSISVLRPSFFLDSQSSSYNNKLPGHGRLVSGSKDSICQRHHLKVMSVIDSLLVASLKQLPKQLPTCNYFSDPLRLGIPAELHRQL